MLGSVKSLAAERRLLGWHSWEAFCGITKYLAGSCDLRVGGTKGKRRDAACVSAALGPRLTKSKAGYLACLPALGLLHVQCRDRAPAEP